MLKDNKAMQAKLQNSRGFTLLELLLALAIFMVVVGAIYSTYLSQQQSYIVQEQVAGVQQNLRAGMFIMERELRLAGYASSLEKPNGLGITALGDNDGRDNDDNGDKDTGTTEQNMGVVFTYMREPDGIDNDKNGTVDDEDDVMVTINYSLYNFNNGTADLGRNDLSGTSDIQAIAENIDFLQFIFLDSSGNPTTTLNSIHSVRITMVARAGREDNKYTDGKDYKDSAGNIVYTGPSDGFRRRVLSTVVKCRNLNLN